jgi:choline dehydrogenase-like flavoprotein
MQTQANSSVDGSSGDAFDFIIVGGGIGGIVVASRLHERDPSLSVLLIEAGPDSSKTPLAEAVASPVKASLLERSELDWSYETVPQKHLDGLEVYVGAGKALGGGSVINYGEIDVLHDLE